MEEEEFFVYARYNQYVAGNSSKGSNTNYGIMKNQLSAVTVSYNRHSGEKNRRIQVDFDPFNYFDDVFLIIIEYHKCYPEHTKNNNFYSIKNLCEYAKIFKTLSEAQEFTKTITDKNFTKFIEEKENKGYKLELSEVFIEPVLISYEK